jgi:hypothetical protein
LDYERLEHFRHLLAVRKSMNGDDEPRGGDVAVGDDGDDDERARHDDDDVVVGPYQVEEQHCYHHMAVAVDAAVECVDDPVAFPAQTHDAPYLVVAVDAAAECADDPTAFPAQNLDAPYPCRDLYTVLVLGRFLYRDHDLSLFLVPFHAPSHPHASFLHLSNLLLLLYHGDIHSSTSHSASRYLHFHST